MTKKPLCIYHANCADGFSAAWVFHMYAGVEFDFHPGVYQSKDLPDVLDRDVYLVDFSYKREAVEAFILMANSVTLIDHHKSALEDLKTLIDSNTIKHHCALDKSGATLAFEFLRGSRQNMPKLLAHVEDRDLWRFALAKTREIQACVFSYPYDFDTWTTLMLETDPDDLATEGAAIERKHFKDVEELIRVTQRDMVIGGYQVPVANMPYTMSSDAGHIMSKGYPFAACYWDTPTGRVFSLRSAPDGADVSAIAVSYGGGGHKHAAGFSVPKDHPLAVA